MFVVIVQIRSGGGLDCGDNSRGVKKQLGFGYVLKEDLIGFFNRLNKGVRERVELRMILVLSLISVVLVLVY